jgi:predicted dehydrogenase
MKVLLIGMGRMGSLHKKYLSELNVDWSWYDPYHSNADKDLELRKISELNNLSEFTHTIIASPTDTHEDMLCKLINTTDLKILVEKPGVINKANIHLLKNDNVSVGMVERFNPSFNTLLRNIDKQNVLNIDFIRCSARPVSRIDTNSFVDVGIHDLDLFCQIYDLKEIKDIMALRKNNTFTLTVQTDAGHIVRFIWSNETFHKERRVCVRQLDYNLQCDLADQVVKKFYITKDSKNVVEDLYVEKKSPLLSELQHFLFKDEKIDAIDSHSIFLDILKNNFTDV